MFRLTLNLNLVLFACLVGAVTPTALAVEFTQNTLIAANDPTYDGQDIIVTGCTVTINGYHPFNSLRIRSNGVVTHSANTDTHVHFLDVDIATFATIEPGSRVDVGGKGYAGGAGPGAGGWVNFRSSGGGHGGNGGDSSTGAAGGVAYGSVLEPITFGSGGGNPGNGGRGGGAVRLTVGGTLTVDGALTASGGAAQTVAGGGGAGGSIYLTVGTLAGSGTITADGGSKGGHIEPGGGAGGRIAIYYGTKTFSGTTTAYGNAGWTRGGAGTIYTKTAADPVGVVYVSNGGNSGAWTPLTSLVAFDLNVAAKAIVYPTAPLVLRSLVVGVDGYLTSSNEVLLDLTVQQNASIIAGGYLTLDSRGYAAGAGPGAGGWVNFRSSGGGHGGNGGDSSTGAAGGVAYGSVLEPITFGSGGGDPGNGGRGGGAVRLTVGGTLTVDGALTASGGAAQTAAGGGGAGGSIYVDVATLAGSGTITADGGSKGGYPEPGGGGGGRIAVYTCDLQMPGGQITVNGGTGWQNGADGTIFHGSPFITITQQPAAQLVFFGTPVTFHVEANTTHGTLHYQWRKDDVNLENTGHYTGVLTHTLNIDAANYDDNGYYDVWLTDDCGNYISDQARLIVPRPGDLNCDGEEDFADINPFVLALSNPAGYTQQFPDCRLLQGDCNDDGKVDFGDINPFVQILTGQ